MIVETEIWCHKDLKLAEMGMDSGDVWMPVSINFKNLTLIKRAGETEFLGPDRCAIQTIDGTQLVINMSYEETLNHWRKSDS